MKTMEFLKFENNEKFELVVENENEERIFLFHPFNKKEKFIYDIEEGFLMNSLNEVVGEIYDEDSYVIENTENICEFLNENKEELTYEDIVEINKILNKIHKRIS